MVQTYPKPPFDTPQQPVPGFDGRMETGSRTRSPAEYAGGSGLISRVVTKSGANERHGSISRYLQNDSLVADDERSTSGGFSTYDTA